VKILLLCPVALNVTFLETHTWKNYLRLILLTNSMDQSFYYCPTTPISSKWLLSFRFLNQNCVCFSCFHMPSPSEISWIDHLNNIWAAVKIMKCLIIQFSPVSCYLLPLRPICLPQCLLLNALSLCCAKFYIEINLIIWFYCGSRLTSNPRQMAVMTEVQSNSWHYRMYFQNISSSEKETPGVRST